MEDTPLHPDTDLVADILGQRPDVSVTHLKLRQKRQGQRLLGTTRWKIARFLLFNQITVFKNHRKSLIQDCERSELRLHLSGQKLAFLIEFFKT